MNIWVHSEGSEASYFVTNDNRVIKSVISTMTAASTDKEVPSLLTLIPTYSRFQEDQYPIHPDDLRWMQIICDKVKAIIGPLPLQVKKSPEKYLPFLQCILKDLENYNKQQQALGDEVDKKLFKLFSLLPQKKMRPLNVHIDNTGLALMHNYLKKNVPANDPKNAVVLTGSLLWEYYFNTKLVVSSGKKQFAGYMVTDGLSASLIVSRPRKPDKDVTVVVVGTKKSNKKWPGSFGKLKPE